MDPGETDPLLQGDASPLAVHAQQRVFPSRIPLPSGFQPEGITRGTGTTFFVGSLAGGAIYQGDARTGAGRILVAPQQGGIAVGLAYDVSSDLLFVAGGNTGSIAVYQARDGTNVASIPVPSSGPATFINDVALTKDAAYFTDSFRPYLYEVPFGRGNQGLDLSQVREIQLTGDFTQNPSGFNANGIVAPPNGKSLIVVNSTTGALYRVDPGTGEAVAIDLGGASVANGDGLLLDGKTLYVVRNFLNQIAVVQLSPDLATGELMDPITSAEFDIPTTVTGIGNALYAVNARFGLPPSPATEYWVTRVGKKK